MHVIDAGFKTIPWVFFAYYGWVSSFLHLLIYCQIWNLFNLIIRFYLNSLQVAFISKYGEVLSSYDNVLSEQMMFCLQYLRDYQTFLGTARYWTETFAKRGSLGIQEKVLSLLLSFFSFITSVLCGWHLSCLLLIDMLDLAASKACGNGLLWRHSKKCSGQLWWGWECSPWKALHWVGVGTWAFDGLAECGVIFSSKVAWKCIFVFATPFLVSAFSFPLPNTTLSSSRWRASGNIQSANCCTSILF